MREGGRERGREMMGGRDLHENVTHWQIETKLIASSTKA